MEKQDNKSKTPGTGKGITSKQVVAFGGVILLVLLYIVTLVMAIVDNSDSGKWFMSCIFATIAIPLLIWIYTWMYGKLTGRHTITDAGRGLGSDPTAASDDAAPENLSSSGDSR